MFHHLCPPLRPRYLGTPSGCCEDLQAAELGDGVQALVPRPEDPAVSGQRPRTQIQENGNRVQWLGSDLTRIVNQSLSYEGVL